MSTAMDPDTPATDPAASRRGVLGSAWLAALLTAVVVGLTVIVGFKAYDAVSLQREVPAQSDQLLDQDARTKLLMDAARLSQRVLTYHYATFEKDLELASARLTPTFGKEYVEAMATVRANTAKNKISQEATVVSAAIISATQDEAEVLVFVNQETSSRRTKAEQLVRNRLVIDLVRGDDRWTIAGVKALG